MSLVGGIGKRVEDLLAGLGLQVTEVLEAFSADAPSELHVFLHDGDSVGGNSAEIGILEQSSQVALGGFLKSEQGVSLEAQLTIDSVADGADESLEGCLGEEHLSGLLVLLDLAEGDSAGPELVLPLHAALGRRGLLDDGLALAGSSGVSLATLGIGGDSLLALGGLGELSGSSLSGDLLSSNLDSWHLCEFSSEVE